MPVTVVKDGMAAFERAVRDLVKNQVLVGIPAEDASRTPAPGEKATLNNAEIGYIQEFGSPEKNIPARPFLMPAVEKMAATITAVYGKAAEKALTDGPAAVEAAHTKIGLAAQVAIRQEILSGSFAPLSERTLQARARRMTSSGKLSKSAVSKQAREELASRAAGNAPSAANAKPLYDTQSLFKSINYVIRRKGS